MSKLLGPLKGRTLSKREIQVLRLVAEGLLSKEIGQRLGISNRTVIGHKNKMRLKTGAKNAANLVYLCSSYLSNS